MSFKVFYSIILLNEIVPLEPETKKFLKDKIQTAFYKKGSYLTRTGELCNRVFVLKKGLVRGYFVNNNKEITTWISRENEMVTSISGYFKNKQGLENIQALEDTYTEFLTFEDMHYSILHFPEMAAINRILLEQYYISAEERAFMARIPNAKDRFDFFVDSSHGHLLQRAPTKFLASLLGMRPETYSRVSKQ